MALYNKPNYRLWKINENNFPSEGSLKEKIKFIADYGVLAPSTHNTQPWVLNVVGNSLFVSIDKSKELKIGDPDRWGIFISLGALIENIKQASDYFGLKTQIMVANDAAEIKFTNLKTKKNSGRILINILHRYSNKLNYKSKKIELKKVNSLKNIQTKNVSLKIITDPKTLQEIINNHVNAAASVAKNPEFARELTTWLRTNNSKQFDGMPGFVIGNSKLKSIIGKALLAKKPQILEKLVVKDRELLKSSPAVIVIILKGNKITNNQTIEAGQVTERLWLKITELGLVAQPMFASIQDPKSRQELSSLLHIKDTPVFFMRVGYSKNNEYHTPRRQSFKAMKSKDKLIKTLDTKIEEKTTVVGKYTLNYAVAGQGQPILLLHGANIGWPQWHRNIVELSKQFKVYALDLPGAGDSSIVNFHKTNFEKDYVEVVDKFIKNLGLKNLNIVGSSFGGWITMRLGIEQKNYIRKIILVNPIGFTQYMPPKFRPISIYPLALLVSKTALKPKRDNKNLEKFMRDVFHDKNINLVPEFVDYFYELSLKSHNALFISRLAHYSGMRKELFLGDNLKKIKIPTLVIWGKEDPLMPYKTVKDNFKAIPNVKIEVLDNIGHMPPVEAPESFNKLTMQFLKTNR